MSRIYIHEIHDYDVLFKLINIMTPQGDKFIDKILRSFKKLIQYLGIREDELLQTYNETIDQFNNDIVAKGDPNSSEMDGIKDSMRKINDNLGNPKKAVDETYVLLTKLYHLSGYKNPIITIDDIVETDCDKKSLGNYSKILTLDLKWVPPVALYLEDITSEPELGHLERGVSKEIIKNYKTDIVLKKGSISKFLLMTKKNKNVLYLLKKSSDIPNIDVILNIEIEQHGKKYILYISRNGCPETRLEIGGTHRPQKNPVDFVDVMGWDLEGALKRKPKKKQRKNTKRKKKTNKKKSIKKKTKKKKRKKSKK
jgi:hypothetical protein